MPRFRIEYEQRGMHTRMRVFVGAEGQGASCGSLVMRFDEADAFFAAIQAGSVGPHGSGAEVEVRCPRAEAALTGEDG